MFSDESRFCLHPSDGRIRVWKVPGEQLADDAIDERVPFGGGSVMVWGGISRHTRTPLYHVEGNLNANRYVNEILRPLVIPGLQQIGPDAIFQDDNARPHRARVTNAFLEQEGVTHMPWPANSPDLNLLDFFGRW